MNANISGGKCMILSFLTLSCVVFEIIISISSYTQSFMVFDFLVVYGHDWRDIMSKVDVNGGLVILTLTIWNYAI